MIVPESRSRDAGKWELKVKREMWVCDCSLTCMEMILKLCGDWKAGFSKLFSSLCKIATSSIYVSTLVMKPSFSVCRSVF